ncbi:hypothetical protein NDU88_007326 [Pleurodeles waltl]|uniref:Uncharacterized protein n=1 Tax=Pleurodeles waltl TaxID=8319 RepID=A0AAV7MIE5_PLEWA|nr:hypothetical protein NDU88_007326 [Pleurodeles waltl]
MSTALSSTIVQRTVLMPTVLLPLLTASLLRLALSTSIFFNSVVEVKSTVDSHLQEKTLVDEMGTRIAVVHNVLDDFATPPEGSVGHGRRENMKQLHRNDKLMKQAGVRRSGLTRLQGYLADYSSMDASLCQAPLL